MMTIVDQWLVVGRHDTAGNLQIVREGFNIPLDDSLDLYFCVAEIAAAATSRKKENALRVRWLVIDDVGSKIDREAFEMMCPLEPSYWIETSAGNFQVGFEIAGGMEVEEYDELRRAMKAHPVWGGSDGADAVHIFRLPRGLNTKPGRGSWPVTLRDGKFGVFNCSELWALAPSGAPQGSGATVGQNTPGVRDPLDEVRTAISPDALAGLLDIISNDDASDREIWVEVAHGVFGATEGSEEGFEAFDHWSRKNPSYDEENTRRLWDGIAPGNVRSRGGLLKQIAEEEDGERFGAWRQRWEAAAVFDDGVVECEPAVSEHASAAAEEVLEELRTYQQTVAAMIEGRDGDRMRWNSKRGVWHEFNGVRWKMTGRKLGFVKAMTWARTAMLDKAERSRVLKASFCDGVEAYLRQSGRMWVEEPDLVFDVDDWKLGTPTGAVDLVSGVWSPLVNPAWMITKATLVDPAEKEDCVRWLKFIDWMSAGDREMKRFLQQWAGYCLTGSTHLEKLLFLWGDGANGKGTYTETLAGILGDYHVEPDKDLFMEKQFQRHRQEIAALAGARMVTTSEVQAGRWDEATLKKVTGGGNISANYMRQDQFTFRVRFKLTISGNDKPTFPGKITEALRRRFLIATFTRVASPIDPDFKPAMMKEAAGILRWAINGLVDLQQIGLMVPTTVQDATKKYLDDQDWFKQWLDGRTAKPGPGQSGDTATVLRSDWAQWKVKENAPHGLAASQLSFADEMRTHGIASRHGMKGSTYEAVLVKQQAADMF